MPKKRNGMVLFGMPKKQSVYIWEGEKISSLAHLVLSAGLIIKMGEKRQEKIKFTFTCMEVS